MPNKKEKLIVGIVGATGMVGRELVDLLERHDFPVKELRPFSSGRKRSSVLYKGDRINAPGIDVSRLSACDIVFMVSSDEIALEHAPRLAAQGIWVIDDSAAFRLDSRVPLVIPEVNASALSLGKKLIAGPNCTMTGLGVSAAQLHREIGIREVRLSSYQAVSGAGKAALGELFSQTKKTKVGLIENECAPVLETGSSHILPRTIAYNVIPQVGRFGKDGSSSEESKVVAELRKIWNAPRLKISVTAVRVPTIRGHALAAWLTLARPTTPQQARALLSKTPGLLLSPEGEYPTPRSVAGKNPVYVGRVRQGTTPREIALWIVSDNLLKGAALNSIQTAEELLRRGWLKPR